MDDKKDFLRVVSAIILFVVYVLIWNLSGGSLYSYNNNLDALFCIRMTIIVTPIYYFIFTKLFRLDFEIVKDFILYMGGFVFSDFVFLRLYLHFANDNEPFGNWQALRVCELYLFMFLIGSSVYVLERYVICNIRNRMYKDMLKRLVYAIMFFLLYLLISYIPVEWIIVMELGIFFIVALTIVFRFISGEVLKVFSKNIQDHVILLSFITCVSIIRYYAINDISQTWDLILRPGIWVMFIYVMGKIYSSAIKDWLKKESRSDSGGKEAESVSNMSQFEMIHIPGIDGDLKDEKSSNDG